MSRAPAASQGFGKMARRATRTLEVAFTTLIAWGFGLATAGVLLIVAAGLYGGDYSVATPLTAAEPSLVAASGLAEASPWGLTFFGTTGALTAAGMATGVLIALGLSMMFGSNPRRLGCLLLAGWAGLWATDAVLMVAHEWNGSGFSVSTQVMAAMAALVVVFGCMVHRMMLLWQVRVTKA